jgi:hypothetical protein
MPCAPSLHRSVGPLETEHPPEATFADPPGAFPPAAPAATPVSGAGPPPLPAALDAHSVEKPWRRVGSTQPVSASRHSLFASPSTGSIAQMPSTSSGVGTDGPGMIERVHDRGGIRRMGQPQEVTRFVSQDAEKVVGPVRNPQSVSTTNV